MAFRLTFDTEKAFQVIHYLKSELEKKRKRLDKLTLMKLLFFADKYHINKYGRLICGGRYVSMDKGHVHSELLDLITTSSNVKTHRSHEVEVVDKPFDLDEFSESDIEALDYAINSYGGLQTAKLIELSHKEPTWNNPYGSSLDIPLENIIESEEIKRYVEFQSREHQEYVNWISGE